MSPHFVNIAWRSMLGWSSEEGHSKGGPGKTVTLHAGTLGACGGFRQAQTLLLEQRSACSHGKLRRGNPDNLEQDTGVTVPQSFWDPCRHCLCSHTAHSIPGRQTSVLKNHNPLAFLDLTTIKLPRFCHGSSFEPAKILLNFVIPNFAVPHSFVSSA